MVYYLKEVRIIKQILTAAKALFENAKQNISLLANASAFINQEIEKINWVGFYLYLDDKLCLGPFQGKPACEVINLNEGVCGFAFKEQKLTNVPDVEQFEGHIACDNASKSELVIPLTKDNFKIGVLDVDSPILNRFDPKTVELLKQIAELVVKYYKL
ncbi:MAG: GAF domain-containing protein [Acholeplasmataceae bacterium]|jgi:GAF domain-containing protein|nr:GAF domain-containing protein [Acholeplasmataceae bacterium]